MNNGDDSKRIRVFSVDDHPRIRKRVAALLKNQPDIELVAEASNGREAIDRYAQCRPDVTLMDLRVRDMSGIAAIASIRAAFPHARIIVLTTYTGDVLALGAFRAGASGYLLKDMLREDLLDTIRAVHAGESRIPPDIATEITEQSIDGALTAREIDVLRRVAVGSSNKLIAAHLKIAESTVKAHMKSIFLKLDASDRTHAVMIAVKRKILDV
jgi:DNA-binding NarL/FixJ family response regulator